MPWTLFLGQLQLDADGFANSGAELPTYVCTQEVRRSISPQKAIRACCVVLWEDVGG